MDIFKKLFKCFQKRDPIMKNIETINNEITSGNLHETNQLINKTIGDVRLIENPVKKLQYISELNACIIERNKKFIPVNGIILQLKSSEKRIIELPTAVVFKIRCDTCKRINRVCGGNVNNVFAPAKCFNCSSVELAVVT